MTDLKTIRTKIADDLKTDTKELAKEMNLSIRSIYRAEDMKKFNDSIFIKYLKFLRKQGIDLNNFFDELK